MADDIDDVLTAVDLLESVMSTSAQHKEVIAKHIQSILLAKHLKPISGIIPVLLHKSIIIIVQYWDNSYYNNYADSAMTILLQLLIKTQKSPFDIKIVYQRKINSNVIFTSYA